MIKELDRNKEAIKLLKESVDHPEDYQKLTANFDVFFGLVKELDAEVSEASL